MCGDGDGGAQQNDTDNEEQDTEDKEVHWQNKTRGACQSGTKRTSETSGIS